jgi:hypothetical protein
LCELSSKKTGHLAENETETPIAVTKSFYSNNLIPSFW